jgi:hypothetical protein
VLSRHRELDRHRHELLSPHDVRHAAEPVLEERLDLGAGYERRVVIQVDVEKHCDLGP